MQFLAKFALIMGCYLVLVGSALAQPNSQNILLTDQKPGSLLVFPLYTSDMGIPTHDTRWVITNTSDSQEVIVHMLMIDRITCEQTDMFICIKPRCSEIFLASVMDPDITGYILAFAVNANNGRPIPRNHLIGNAFVKAPAGSPTTGLIAAGGAVEGNYAAESFRAYFTGALPAPGGIATLDFNGTEYDQVGRWLSTSVQLPANAPGQTIFTVGLAGSVPDVEIAGAGQIGAGIAYNGREKAASFSNFLKGDCFASAMITDSSPRVPGQFFNLLQNGDNIGTLKFQIGGGVGLLVTPQNANGWSGITPLTKVTPTTTSLDVLVLTPDCTFD
jgi:hypothetical protein